MRAAVDARKLASKVTLTLTIKHGRQWRGRIWIAGKLIRLACWIGWIGYRERVDFDCEDRDGPWDLTTGVAYPGTHSTAVVEGHKIEVYKEIARCACGGEMRYAPYLRVPAHLGALVHVCRECGNEVLMELTYPHETWGKEEAS